MFSQIYNSILIDPITNLLIYVYNILPIQDLGLAIIIVTVIIRLLLVPLASKTLKSQIAMQELQPKLAKIKKEAAGNKEEEAKKTMELYREHKVNPLGSCLPLVIQFPIIIALYSVFQTGLSTENLTNLYPYVAKPETLNAMFLGIVNLTEPNVVMAVLAGLFQFGQTRMLSSSNKKKEGKTKEMVTSDGMPNMENISKQMMYFFPLITIFIGMSLPAALTLYWIVVTAFAVIQQYVLKKRFNVDGDAK